MVSKDSHKARTAIVVYAPNGCTPDSADNARDHLRAVSVASCYAVSARDTRGVIVDSR